MSILSVSDGVALFKVPVASSPGCGEDTTQSGKGCHHLIPKEGLAVVRVGGEEIKGVGSSWWWMPGQMAKRVAKDTFPISSWRGHINTPQASGGQACSATPQVARKERQSLSSSSMASSSIHCKLSIGLSDGAGMIYTAGLCLPNGCSTMGLHLPNSLHDFGLILMNSCLKADTCFLQQASMDALVISRCIMALFISSWSKITSLGRVPKLAPIGVLVGGVVETLAIPGVWLIDVVLWGIATHGDAWEEVATVLNESSALIKGGTPKAANVDLFRVGFLNAWLKVPSRACNRSSHT